MSPLSDRLDGPWAGDVTFARARRCDAHKRTDFADADLAVVGVPFDLAVTNRPGARFGPRAIREQSLLVGEFPWGLWPWGFDPFEAHTIIDAGDVPGSMMWTGASELMIDAAEQWIGPFGSSTAILGLGGDHAISYPLLRAATVHHGPLSLVHFDSHTDTWNLGDALNHGSVFRRAVDEGLVDASRSVQVGIRTPNPDTMGIAVIDAEMLADAGPKAVAETVREIVGASPVYLTLDIDFLDPAFAPGTGTPVVGGPSTADARRLLRGLSGLQVVGADLVEVAPAYDPTGHITALAAATLALDLVHLLLHPDSPRGGARR